MRPSAGRQGRGAREDPRVARLEHRERLGGEPVSGRPGAPLGDDDAPALEARDRRAQRARRHVRLRRRVLRRDARRVRGRRPADATPRSPSASRAGDEIDVHYRGEVITLGRPRLLGARAQRAARTSSSARGRARRRPALPDRGRPRPTADARRRRRRRQQRCAARFEHGSSRRSTGAARRTSGSAPTSSSTRSRSSSPRPSTASCRSTPTRTRHGSSTFIVETTTTWRARPRPRERGGRHRERTCSRRTATADREPLALDRFRRRPQPVAGGTRTSCCSATPRTPRTSRSARAPSSRWRTRSRCAGAARDADDIATRSTPTRPSGGRSWRARSARRRRASSGSRGSGATSDSGAAPRSPSTCSPAAGGSRTTTAAARSRASSPTVDAAGQAAVADRPPMFTPFRLRDLELANRVVVSPMDMYSAVDGTPDDFHLVHLGARAIGGAGLVMTEMICVSARGPDHARLRRPVPRRAHRRVAADRRLRAHALARAQIGAQLGHAGRKGSTKLLWEGEDEPLDAGQLAADRAVADPVPAGRQPGAARDDARRHGRGARRVRRRHARAAEAAGFDLLELHMAHGYLLSCSSRRSPTCATTSTAAPTRAALPARGPRRVPRRVAGESRCRCASRRTDWAPGGFDGDDAVAFARRLRRTAATSSTSRPGRSRPTQRPPTGAATRRRSPTGSATRPGSR